MRCSELRKHSESLSLGSLDDYATIPDGGSRVALCRDRGFLRLFYPDVFSPPCTPARSQSHGCHQFSSGIRIFHGRYLRGN